MVGDNVFIGYLAGCNTTGEYSIPIGTETCDIDLYKRCPYCNTLHNQDALFCRACQASF